MYTPADNHVTSMRMIKNLSMITFLLTINRKHLSRLLMLQIIRVTMYQQSKASLEPVRPILMRMLSRINNNYKFHHKTIQVLRLRPITLMRRIRQVINTMLRNINLHCLINTRNIKRVTLHPHTGLHRRNLTKARHLLTISIRQNSRANIMHFLRLLRKLTPRILNRIIRVILGHTTHTMRRKRRNPQRVTMDRHMNTLKRLTLRILSLISNSRSIIRSMLRIMLLSRILIMMSNRLMRVRQGTMNLTVSNSTLPDNKRRTTLLRIQNSLLPVIRNIRRALKLRGNNLRLITSSSIKSILTNLRRKVSLHNRVTTIRQLRGSLMVTLNIMFLSSTLRYEAIVTRRVIPRMGNLTFAQENATTSNNGRGSG